MIIKSSGIIFIIIVIFSSCERSDDELFDKVIASTDKVFLRTYDDKGRGICLSKFLDGNNIDYLKASIPNTFEILEELEINPVHHLSLYSGDSLLGNVWVDSTEGNKIQYVCTTFQVFIELEFDIGDYLNNLTNIKNIDCSDCYKRIRLDTVSVREFISILRVQNQIPHKTYFISVWGEVSKDWILDDDISYLISLIDNEDQAYCVGSPLSSNAYTGTNNFSTIGGHAINLIDFYRFKNIAPVYHPICPENDSIKKNEILNWWKNINVN